MEILFINRFDSYCGSCKKGADPDEKKHDTILGWAESYPPGCGVTWTHVSTDYVGVDPARTRPDLIPLDPLTGEEIVNEPSERQDHWD